MLTNIDFWRLQCHKNNFLVFNLKLLVFDKKEA